MSEGNDKFGRNIQYRQKSTMAGIQIRKATKVSSNDKSKRD